MEMNTCSFNTAIQSQSLAGNWSLPHLASLSHSLTRIFGAETKRNSGKVAAWSDPKSSTVCVCSSLAEAEGSRTAQGHWIFTLVITRHSKDTMRRVRRGNQSAVRICIHFFPGLNMASLVRFCLVPGNMARVGNARHYQCLNCTRFLICQLDLPQRNTARERMMIALIVPCTRLQHRHLGVRQ